MNTDKYKSKVYIILILIFAAILRLFQLGIRPFDGDEGIMVLIANNNWRDLLSKTAQDVHPPLYHLLLKIFISFGINEISARLLSVLAAIISIYFIYIFAKKIFDKKIALIASIFAAISPYLIYPTQEARMYSLFLLLSLISYYFFLSLIELRNFPSIAFGINKVSQTRWYFVGYIISSVLAIYTHYLGFIIIGSQILYLIFNKEQYKEIKTWIILYLSIFILFVPQISIMISQFSARLIEKSHTVSILTNIKGLIGAFYRFGAGRLFLNINSSDIKSMLSDNILLFIIFMLSIIIPFAIFIYGKLKLFLTEKKKFWFILTPMVIAVLLAIVSAEVGSRSTRYLIYIYPFYIIVVSYGVFNIWKNWWGKILTILFILINLSGIFIHFSRDVKAPGVDKIAQFISEKYQDGDIILVRGGFGGGEEWILEYYWDKLRTTNYELRIYDLLGDYKPGNLAELKEVDPEDKIHELLDQNQRVWFYDLTYDTENIENAEKHYLGKDKEQKDLIIWETTQNNTDVNTEKQIP